MPKCHYWRTDKARCRFDLACAKDPEPRNICDGCHKCRLITDDFWRRSACKEEVAA